MKKTASVFFSALLSLSLLAGCNAGAAPSSQASAAATPASSAASAASSPEGSAPAADAVLQIGLAQIVEHRSLDQIRIAFTTELERLGYGPDKVAIDYQNAQGDQSNLTTICQKFAGDSKDLIVAIATPTAQAAAAQAPSIPLLFSAVTDPVAAKLLTDPQKPEGNATGTSDAIPVEQVFALMKRFNPNLKTVGMMYNLGEVNSVSVIEQAKAYCDTNGLTYVEANVTSTGEVQQAAQSLIGKVDAIYSPIDNTVASAMPVLADVARQAKLPVYTGADSMVIDGGFATVGIDYDQLGKQTAAMAVKVLEGTPISEIPVETLSNFSTIINKTTAAALGIELPEDLAATAIIVE